MDAEQADLTLYSTLFQNHTYLLSLIEVKMTANAYQTIQKTANVATSIKLIVLSCFDCLISMYFWCTIIDKKLISIGKK